jgi:LacI family transcriptional regulator
MSLRVPENVAVLGASSNDVICRATTPALSSVDLDSERVGFEAARLLDHLLHRRKPPDGPILIPPRGVVVRESSEWVPAHDAQVAATLRYIRDNSGGPINIKGLARVSTLSRQALDRHFKKVLKRTVSQEIKRLRLQKAKQLLEQTPMSLEAVARTSGFGDSRILCRVFRAAMSLLPSQYRRNVQNRTLFER